MLLRVICEASHLAKIQSRYIIKKNTIINRVKYSVRSYHGNHAQKHIKVPLIVKIIGCPISALLIRQNLNGRVKCEGLVHPSVPLKVERKTNWTLLLKFIFEDILLIILAIMASLSAAYFNTVIPLHLGKIVNVLSKMIETGLSGEHLHIELKQNTLQMLFLCLSQAFSTCCYISLLGYVGEHLAFKLRRSLFKSIINQDIEFFDTQRTGELIDCLTSDVQEFKSSFKVCVNQGLRSVTQVVGCVISIFLFSPQLTQGLLLVIPPVILIGFLFGSILRGISRDAQKESVTATVISDEVINNVRTVKAFGNENEELKTYMTHIEKAATLNTILGCGIGIFQGCTNLFLNGIVCGSLFAGGMLLTAHSLSPGDIMTFLASTQTIQKSLAQLSLIFGTFIKGKQAAIRILHYIDLEPKIVSDYDGIRISGNSFIPNIEFNNVTFTYPTRANQVILQNLNIRIPPGKTIAIVGASGNGKSTIVALLERFYDVDDGSIKISGVDIRKLDLKWLRQSVLGLINQEPTLFATTVRENIRYGKSTASDSEVYNAARLANADGFIRSFPEGYDTVLGEKGITVSGGQKQRIALARVLLKNPAILILDEATSALDPEAEKIVQKTLEDISRGRTVLVIAHRLTTIQNADEIIVLEKGKVVEIGTHQELCKKKGHYYNLMMQQRKEEK